MALRTLTARMRASALRLRVPPPAPRNPPPPAPGVRPRFCSNSAQGGLQGKRFDLEKASEEELLRESELISKQIHEAWEAVEREKEKVPDLTKDLFRIVKMSFGVGILIEIMSHFAPMSHPAAQPEQ